MGFPWDTASLAKTVKAVKIPLRAVFVKIKASLKDIGLSLDVRPKQW